ncbi:uncharacterized protein LOC132735626 [Ruditapes philippinarum]|uniref:uncharacterized protein LOC132735626 n=1 Tax=Ruditapes philippinarum TaxID=129788 RepID=UPI00295A9200|nr:uncharacterized protein LOC132735626 [Ruditapes philippinarum]
MEEISANDNRRAAKSTFKDILISPNNDDVIIPISTTFDKAVLHIGIGNGCGIFIEKFGMKIGKELKTSVKYATRKFTDARNQRKNKGKYIKARKREDIEKIVDESGEMFTRDIPSIEETDRQLAKLADYVLVRAPTEHKNAIDIISDTKPLKEIKSLDIDSDVADTDERIQSTIGKVFTSDIKYDKRRIPMHEKVIAEITAPHFDYQTMVEPNMKIHLYKLNETRFKAERTNSFEAIDKAYQEEMLQIAIDKEAGAHEPTNIWPLAESGSGFSLSEDMHVYLDEVFVFSKRSSQMFDDYVSETKEKNRKEKQQEDVSESGTTRGVVDIDKDYPVADGNLFGRALDKGQRRKISSDTILDRAADKDSDTLNGMDPDTFGEFLDIESDNSMSKDMSAVGKTSDNDTIDEIVDIKSDDEIVDIIESNDDIIDIVAIALQDQDEADITAARNDIDDTYNDVVDDDDNLFGIMDLYINSELHFDLHNMPASPEEFGQKKDFGYKFFSFSTFFK